MSTVIPNSKAASTSSSSVYASNHDAATLRTHEWRTVANSAAYLIPYLKPDMKILDVGCGPGSITIDLARYVPDGYVIGVEYASKPLTAARLLAEKKQVTNVQFAVADALDLKEYADNTFDVVHAHQVLQHVPDPVRALREMRRVVRPGGLLALRESATMGWYPRLKGLDQWYDIYRKVGKGLGGNPDPGSYIHVWAQEAGFGREDITCSAGTWCFSAPDERKWWSDIWAERVLAASYVEKAEQGGYCTREDLSRIASTWKAWGEDKDGWFTITHGEIICRK
ncbi:ubiE/COQ5 methyltransferase [Talaromyces proteolyticus]|uniref:UbiE/COQ5 methyltransferase n=1 Tax=Talaromyces proteolyticus TaxID=1131652 RepID=A0AAD4L007_9EURO|nr:ubiE/COQ5 methyltransferase [Talaromyces proteolyticus]KAH8704167.1 ubiE/COQ5 methyltransferase [Talaromyces proteolyticus]